MPVGRRGWEWGRGGTNDKAAADDDAEVEQIAGAPQVAQAVAGLFRHELHLQHATPGSEDGVGDVPLPP